MELSRTKNTIRNIFAGFLGRIVGLILPFVVRTVVLHKMGTDYAGLGSLFSSILQVLNVAELGFSSAIIFSLYKPVALGDKREICDLLALYRRIFQIVGSVIFIAGCMVLPFLRLLIKGDYPNDVNLYVLFLIYLLNNVITYFAFGYKNVVLTAYQRQDIISSIDLCVNILRSAIQIFVVLAFNNYYLYVIWLPAFSLISNFAVEIITRKKFPDLVAAKKVRKEKLNSISKQVKGVALGKFSLVARNAFDSIILSMLFGLTTVTTYSNYYFIFSSVGAILIVFLQAMSASVGNSLATESIEKNLKDYYKFDFYFSWIVSWCTICMVCLYQPFMTIWVGADLLLPYHTMVLFCLYFYVNNLSQVRSVYSEAAGFWWYFRYITVSEMVANLVLNVTLGLWIGIDGIILATIITAFLSSFIGLTMITFRKLFKVSCKKYYLHSLFYFGVTVFLGIICVVLCSAVPVEGIVGIAVRAMICIIVPNLGFLVIYSCVREFREYCKGALQMIFPKK